MQKTYPQSDLPIRDGKRDESKSRIYKNIAKCMKGIHNVIFLLREGDESIFGRCRNIAKCLRVCTI